jgi:hypothetical protein
LLEPPCELEVGEVKLGLPVESHDGRVEQAVAPGVEGSQPGKRGGVLPGQALEDLRLDVVGVALVPEVGQEVLDFSLPEAAESLLDLGAVIRPSFVTGHRDSGSLDEKRIADRSQVAAEASYLGAHRHEALRSDVAREVFSETEERPRAHRQGGEAVVEPAHRAPVVLGCVEEPSLLVVAASEVLVDLSHPAQERPRPLHTLSESPGARSSSGVLDVARDLLAVADHGGVDQGSAEQLLQVVLATTGNQCGHDLLQVEVFPEVSSGGLPLARERLGRLLEEQAAGRFALRAHLHAFGALASHFFHRYARP